MQPYIFPYIGYFHLIEATDMFVFYDDVSFIKGGWINRNRILINETDSLFTVPLMKSSSHKLICETMLHPTLYLNWKKKFIKTLKQNYSKAPFFKESIDLINSVFELECTSIGDLAINSILLVCQYLKMDFTWTISSEISPETTGLKKEERIIEINKKLGSKNYINAIGGQELYSHENFLRQGIQLNFIESTIKEYIQFKNEFIPWLSIIDVLMFNSKDEIKEQLKSYNVI